MHLNDTKNINMDNKDVEIKIILLSSYFPFRITVDSVTVLFLGIIKIVVIVSTFGMIEFPLFTPKKRKICNNSAHTWLISQTSVKNVFILFVLASL